MRFKVLFKIAFESGFERTAGAAVGPLASVDTNVALQVFAFGESFPAERASVDSRHETFARASIAAGR